MSAKNFFNQSNPEIHAIDLRYKLRTGPGFVDLDDMCARLDIDIIEDDLDTSGNVCGCLVREGNAAIILINKYMDYIGRKRFTIAHELGHFFIPTHNNSTYECDRFNIEQFGNTGQETEANIFASELLLPTKEAKEIVRKHPVSYSLIESTAKQYGMSLSAVAVKLVKLTQDDICAVALSVSDSGKVLWSIRSPKFIRKGLDLKRTILTPSNVKTQEHPSQYLIGNMLTSIPFLWMESIPFNKLDIQLSVITVPDDDEQDANWDNF
ncbi:MAG: ImmA/IrrE family metallo-endopeptidase [Veillonellales bacterium]